MVSTRQWSFITPVLVAAIAVIVVGPLSASAASRAFVEGMVVSPSEGVAGSTCIQTVDGMPFGPGVSTQDCGSVPPVVPTVAPTLERPGPSNTGPRVGTQLRQVTGDMIVRDANAVIDSVQINGTVRIEAANVTIRNSYIAGRSGLTTGQPLVYAGLSSANGLRVIDSEIAPSDERWIVNGIFGYGFSAIRTDVHNVIDAIHIFGDNVTVESSWLHDNYHGPDSTQSDGVTHDDSVQVQRGNNLSLIRNTMSGAYNAALQITQDQGSVSNLTYRENWTSGGACTLNIAEKSGGVIVGLIVTGNRFGVSRYSCPIILSPAVKSISTLTGNVWETSGQIHLTCREDGRPNWRC